MKKLLHRLRQECGCLMVLAISAGIIVATISVVAPLNGAQAAQAYTAKSSKVSAPGKVPTLDHQAPFNEYPLLTSWQPITQFSAVWQDEHGKPTTLDRDSTYWTQDDITSGANTFGGDISSSEVGKLFPALMRNKFNPTGAPTGYETSAVLYFQPNVAMSAAANPFGNGVYLFSSQAMGIYGGQIRNPKGALSIYFWSWNGGATSTNRCSAIDSRKYGFYTPVVRVDDYAAGSDPNDKTGGGANIFMNCMPTPGGSDSAGGGRFGYPATGNPQATGGEINQSTGFIYIAGTTSGNVINVGGNSTKQNDAGIQYAIWDPVEGTFSLSGPIQAGDWVPGMGSPPKDQLATTISNIEHQPKACSTQAVFAEAQETYNGACTYSTGLQSSPDMGLDAAGNFYTYVATNGYNSNRGTTAILKTKPHLTTDSTGDQAIHDGSVSTPWRYSLVTHTFQGSSYQPSGYGYPANWAVGVGIHNGTLLLAGYYPLYGTFKPLGWDHTVIGPGSCGSGTSTTPATCFQGPNSQVRVSPLTGEMQIIAATNNPDIVKPYGSQNHFYPTNTGLLDKDSASAQELVVIQGNVYNDALSSADYSQFKDNGLSGMTMDLYDSTGALVGTTKTSSDGSYNFIVSGEGTYYVRLVQPQVDGVNAYQTWASTSDGVGTDKSGTASTSTVVCANGDVSSSSGTAGAACQGALPFPYKDTNPPLNSDGTQQTYRVDPSWNNGSPQWGTYGKVTVGSSSQIPKVNFAVSSSYGSFGDASGSTPASGNVPANIGPFNTTKAQRGPFFSNPNNLPDIFRNSGSIQLGKKQGHYSDGSPDSNANSSVADPVTGDKHTDTDDGVYVVLPANASQDTSTFCTDNPTYMNISTVPLQGASLTAGYTYCILANVQGQAAAKESSAGTPSVVLGWQSSPGAQAFGGWTAVASTLVYGQYAGSRSDGKGDASKTFSTITVPMQSNPALPVQMRFMVMSNSFFTANGGDSSNIINSTVPVDNTSGAYNGPQAFSASANTEYWVQPGEIEDSQYYDVNSSLRIVAKVAKGDSVSSSIKPVIIKYNLDSSTTSPSTDKDSIGLLAIGSPFTSSAIHLPTDSSSSSSSSITVTTGLPMASAGNHDQQLLLSTKRGDPIDCTGSYVGHSGAIVSYGVTVSKLEDDSTVPQPQDQQSADKSNISFKVSSYFNPTKDLPAQSGQNIVCEVNYSIEGHDGTLPDAGSFPWLTVSAIVVLTIGSLLSGAYMVDWLRQRSALQRECRDRGKKM